MQKYVCPDCGNTFTTEEDLSELPVYCNLARAVTIARSIRDVDAFFNALMGNDVGARARWCGWTKLLD